MTRPWDYDVRLLLWAETMLGRPFVWGETDCASLMRAALIVQFGPEAVAGTPRYTSLKSASDALAEVESVRAWLLAHGATETMITMARPGDVIVTPRQEDELTDSVFVVVASGRMLATNPGEVVTMKRITQLLPGSVALRMPDVWPNA